MLFGETDDLSDLAGQALEHDVNMLSSDCHRDDHRIGAGKTLDKRCENLAPFLRREPNRVCHQKRLTMKKTLGVPSAWGRRLVVPLDVLAMMSCAEPTRVAG